MKKAKKILRAIKRANVSVLAFGLLTSCGAAPGEWEELSQLGANEISIDAKMQNARIQEDGGEKSEALSSKEVELVARIAKNLNGTRQEAYKFGKKIIAFKSGQEFGWKQVYGYSLKCLEHEKGDMKACMACVVGEGGNSAQEHNEELVNAWCAFIGGCCWPL